MSLGRTTFALALLLAASRADAQGLVTPTAHWGGSVLPDLHERSEVGVHFLGFTRFGKEVDSTGARYTFTPYNDMDETLGFNLATYSCSRGMRAGGIRPLGCLFGDRRRGDLSAPASTSPLLKRETYTIGVIDDHIPAFLQNRVIHGSNLRKRHLLNIPRDTSDTFDATSYGPFKKMPLLGYSEEYFLRMVSPRRNAQGVDERIPTPFFVGGGWSVGTIDHEAFLHAGAAVAEVEIPRPRKRWANRVSRVLWVRSVGIGGMARGGVVLPSHHLRDLTAQYFNAQATLRASVEWGSFPTQFELTTTAANGFFVAGRGDAQMAVVRELGPGADAARVYASKASLNERFIALRVRIGDFTFETYNDTFGNKDKGPSFGAHVMYNFYRPREEFRTPPRNER